MVVVYDQVSVSYGYAKILRLHFIVTQTQQRHVPNVVHAAHQKLLNMCQFDNN